MTMELTINGSGRTLTRSTNLVDMLDELDLDPRAVVVERNREIIRRDQLASTPLQAGDVIEIVHFVGGG